MLKTLIQVWPYSESFCESPYGFCNFVTAQRSKPGGALRRSHRHTQILGLIKTISSRQRKRAAFRIKRVKRLMS